MRQLIFISALLLTSLSAHAIPPPDALLSIWQSALQMLGMASVFLVGIYYSIKHFFSQYFSSWKKLLLGLGLTSLVAVGLYSVMNPSSKPTHVPDNTNTYPNIPQTASPSEQLTPIQGDMLSVETVIAYETNEFIRNWKLKTYKEMKQELEEMRKQKNLIPVQYSNITSFSPKDLQQKLIDSPDKLFFLDVRGAFERKKFYLDYQTSIHYGDLLNDVIPSKLKEVLPKNKRIVVLCHSGLRGYLAANLLKHLGYENVAFLQGGLANWKQQNLAINGNEDYSAGASIYPVFAEQKAYESDDLLKIQIDSDNEIISDMENLVQLPFEVATSTEINDIVQKSKQKPVLIVCNSYGGCFHISNFGLLIEQAGGKVAGVFDKTQQFVIPPIIEKP